MTEYTIIVNPAAGRGNGEKHYPIIEERCTDLGLDFSMKRTQQPGHAIELTKQACKEGSKIIVAVGGDGTANEVINGIMLAQKDELIQATMGILSVGRGNDFAYGVGIKQDFETACLALKNQKKKKIDVGFVQGGEFPKGRYFGNGVGIGFDAVVGFEALKLKRLHGFPSYIVAALKTIFLYFHAPTVQIEFNDHIMEQPALMVSVMNGRRMGGGFLMAPEGKNDDGQFDICIADQVSRIAIFGLIIKFMQGKQAGHPAIHMARTESIKVTAVNGNLPAHADGETLCIDGKQLNMRIHHQAVEIIT